jgi:two-component system, OmpR family, phosphate regulon sensor histidine kinase PhoR
LKLGIRAKLFLISVGLIIVSVVVAYYYLRSALQTWFIDEVRENLHVRADLVAAQAVSAKLPADDLTGWDNLANHAGEQARARVTLIASDGRVLGDSDVGVQALGQLENHRERPEVREALLGRTSFSRRYSSTIHGEMLYSAVTVLGDSPVAVARVALPLSTVDQTAEALRNTLLIATILALAVAIVMSSAAAEFASRTARSLTATARRMAEGDLETRSRLIGSGEFVELGAALDGLAKNLSSTLVALKGERDRMSGILTGMQEGVLFLDRSGRVALINPALREMLLLGADSVGKTLLEVIRHAELKELLDHAQRGREPMQREIEVSGLKPRRLLVRVAQLEAQEGGVFAVFVDVTEMRRLESMRRDFVANVSHELRTPVTAIRSAAETLQTALERDPPAVGQFVGIIERNAERLRDLVEDLLDLSRIESREYRLHYEALTLSDVFSHVLSLFRERADKRELSIEFEIPDEIPRVRGDRRALEHVLTNLVDNAVKYCPEGAAVRLSAELVGENIRVLVEDNGPGIEEKHLPRLFERFYRVDAGRSRELGGTGLGLSIVKHLVESMGGNISVESALGRGATFSFTLAKADATLATVPPPRVTLEHSA